MKKTIPKKLFHNGSNYNYHFIIKELAKEFDGEFNCLRENTEKYKSFSVPITKEVKRIVKNGEENTKTISYRLQFTDSRRFTTSLLSNIVDNFPEGVHKVKSKREHDVKKWVA